MDNNSSVNKIDMSKLLSNVFMGLKRFLLTVICFAVILGGVMGIRAWRSYVPMYRSEAIFSVSSGNLSSTDVFGYSYYYDNTAASQVAALFPYILNSDSMNERLKIALDADYINGSISASSIADTNLFVLTVTSSSPEEAYRILEAVIEVYPQMSYLMSGNVQLKITQEPTMSTEPYNSRNWIGSAGKGAVVGLILGLALIVAWAYMQKTVYNSDEIKQFLNVPYLGSVPVMKSRRRETEKKPLTVENASESSQFSEAFRTIRMKLVRLLAKDKSKVVMFTSTLQDEGKTTIAVNTAITLAKDGCNVVLVDGDLRNASIKKLLGIDKETKGLGDYLTQDKISNINFVHNKETNLYILAGDPRGYDMNKVFNRSRLDTLFRNLADNFDYVIVDAPPCAITADAVKLCRYADKVVYVVRENYANQAQIYTSVQSLYDNGADVCGLVMNYKSGKTGIDKYNYGYKYGNGYGYGYGYGKKSGYDRKSKSRYGISSEKKKEK